MPFRRYEPAHLDAMVHRMYIAMRVILVGLMAIMVALIAVIIIFKNVFGFLDDRRVKSDDRQRSNEAFEKRTNKQLHDVVCLALRYTPPNQEFGQALRKQFPDCPPYKPPPSSRVGGSSASTPPGRSSGGSAPRPTVTATATRQRPAQPRRTVTTTAPAPAPSTTRPTPQPSPTSTTPPPRCIKLIVSACLP